jgi:hypothetical protein
MGTARDPVMGSARATEMARDPVMGSAWATEMAAELGTVWATELVAELGTVWATELAAELALESVRVQDLAGATVSDPGVNSQEMATAAFRGDPTRSETATA